MSKIIVTLSSTVILLFYIFSNVAEAKIKTNVIKISVVMKKKKSYKKYSKSK